MKVGVGEQAIAKSLVADSDNWLNLLAELSSISPETGAALQSRCNALIAGLTRRITSLEDREKSIRVREELSSYRASLSEVPTFKGSKVPERDEWQDLP
jgi:hypothetical protein